MSTMLRLFAVAMTVALALLMSTLDGGAAHASSPCYQWGPAEEPEYSSCLAGYAAMCSDGLRAHGAGADLHLSGEPDLVAVCDDKLASYVKHHSGQKVDQYSFDAGCVQAQNFLIDVGYAY